MTPPRNLWNEQVAPAEIAAYYQRFVSEMGLRKSFAQRSCVTSLCRVGAVESETGRVRSTRGESGYETGTRSLWEAKGYETGADGAQTPFLIFAENVVLATGTQDQPVTLGVEGEDLPYVCHSVAQLKAAIARCELSEDSEPVLIVGAGLSAADAILNAHHCGIRVVHSFRRAVTDPSLIFNLLPKLLYPQYHKVHQMMIDQSVGEESHSYRGYTGFSQHQVGAFTPDSKCILETCDKRQTAVNVSLAVVLIGAHPNLSFLPNNGCYLGVNTKMPISCHSNPLQVHPYTYELLQEPNLFAMGPLVGDNFVRFVKGGALGIASCLGKRRKEQGQVPGK